MILRAALLRYRKCSKLLVVKPKANGFCLHVVITDRSIEVDRQVLTAVAWFPVSTYFLPWRLQRLDTQLLQMPPHFEFRTEGEQQIDLHRKHPLGRKNPAKCGFVSVL